MTKARDTRSQGNRSPIRGDGRCHAATASDSSHLTRQDTDDVLRFQSELLDATGQAVIAVDPDLNVIYWNRAAEALFGWTEVEALGRKSTDLISREETPEQYPAFAAALLDGRSWSCEYEIKRRDGTRVFAFVTNTPVFDAAGRLTAVIKAAVDLTEHRDAERVHRRAETQFEIGFEQSTIGAVIANLEGIPTRVNPAVCSMLGRSEDLLIGRTWMEFAHPDDESLGQKVILRMNAGYDTYEDVRRYIRPDKSIVWVQSHVNLVRSDAGVAQYFFAQLEDITVRKGLETELAHRALHDSLTGLPNRTLLTDRLVHALAGSRRRGSQLGVMFINVDNFKSVNDSVGHSIGDELLFVAGARIAAEIRAGDTVARFGGDEFVVVCDDATADETVHIAERVLAALSRPCQISTKEVLVTASLGIAFADGHSTPETLLRDADAAMYRAKQRGRGRVELFDEALRRKAERRWITASALNHAFERGELAVHYQPVIDLTSGEMRSVEALLRWNHPDRGLVLPAEFIPLAEETGLIVPIGAWVLEQACTQLVEWQAIQTWTPRSTRLSVAVNLSVRQILAPDIVGCVAAILSRTGAHPGDICLELTEGLFMEEIDFFEPTLEAIKALGVDLAIDDFGTGYSSLSYLKRFPIDVVKIDRTFVDGLDTDPHASALVAAIVAMAGALDLAVVAEGVETPRQLAALRRLPVARAQGFFLARPLPADAITPLVTQSHRWFGETRS